MRGLLLLAVQAGYHTAEAKLKGEEMAHSPEPWTIIDAELLHGVFGKAIVSARGDPVAFVYNSFSDVQEDNATLLHAAPDMLAACKAVAARPAKAQEMMRREGFVIDDLTDRWQKLAFTLYTYLAEDATRAAVAIAKAEARG